MKHTVLFFLLVTSITGFAQKPKVAFVLSGGGARGFAHVGVLKVLEEVGFKPDIITGTSMGSIIGGLYSIGYRSDTIEQIIQQTEWNDIIYDKVSRNTLNAIERERYSRYFAKFNFEGTKFISYSGFIKGTKVRNMLTRLCLPAANITDFNKLPIPFACVATDIQSGKKVLLNHGSLPDAIRASMAIPSLFTYMEIDGKILVDGGLTQNYPIIEAKNMGADYIIGIDVGSKSSKEELGSFVNVIMESMFLHGYQNYDAEKKDLSINIKPALGTFAPLDFEEGDSIMKLGEAAARLQIDELKALYKRIYGKESVKEITTNQSTLNKKYKVNQVVVEGLKNVDKVQIHAIISMVEKKEITSEEMEDVIKQLENSNLFDRILYKYENHFGEGKMVISVTEKVRGDFDIGINYNVYHDASLLLGIAYRRFLFKGTTIKADMRLSSMPRLDLSYYFQTRYRPAFGIEASINNIEQGLYTDTSNIKSYSSYNILSSVYLKAKFNISNQRNVGVGFGVEEVNNSTEAFSNFGQISELTNSKQSNNLVLFYREDTRDDAYIATRGGRLLVDVYFANNDFNINKSWLSGLLRFEKHARFTNRLSLGNFVNVGFNDNNYQTGNGQFRFSTGGMLDIRFRNYLPFGGLEFAQKVVNNIATYRFKPTFRLFKGNYVALIGDVGNTTAQPNDMLKFSNVMYAWGTSYEYRSPIGPIQFNVSRSNVRKEFMFYMNLGFWF